MLSADRRRAPSSCLPVPAWSDFGSFALEVGSRLRRKRSGVPTRWRPDAGACRGANFVEAPSRRKPAARRFVAHQPVGGLTIEKFRKCTVTGGALFLLDPGGRLEVFNTVVPHSVPVWTIYRAG